MFKKVRLEVIQKTPEQLNFQNIQWLVSEFASTFISWLADKCNVLISNNIQHQNYIHTVKYLCDSVDSCVPH